MWYVCLGDGEPRCKLSFDVLSSPLRREPQTENCRLEDRPRSVCFDSPDRAIDLCVTMAEGYETR